MSEEFEKLTRYERLFLAALRIRHVEERIIRLYPSDRIQSPVHLSIGQEAVAVGVCEKLGTTDLLFSSYRSHAFYLAKGGDMLGMFAELYGRSTGISMGKAGSMHLAAPEVGMMGSSAVVASTLPHAAGAALAAKLRNSGQIVVCVYGDGATEEGVYHETINFVALHQLPVLLVCENNGLAVHTSLRERQSYSICEHVRCYGIDASKIDEGFDFLKIADHLNGVLDQMRKDKKPHFVEIHTCRYKEHVGPGEDFDAGYRSSAEVDSWKARDPLLSDQELLRKFSPVIEIEIDKAVAFAEASPLPGREQLLTHVL